jgi:hypothetical protein
MYVLRLESWHEGQVAFTDNASNVNDTKLQIPKYII